MIIKESLIEDGTPLQHIIRRVCENSVWHKEVEVKQFQKCPECNSESYHLGVMKVE